MADTMNAVLNYAPNDYRLERIPIPKIVAEEVLIKIDAAGICGSDGKCFHGAPSFWDKPGSRRRWCPGHEFFGTVVELGAGAGEKFGIKLGDKVIAEQIVPCDRCRYCQRGQYWMCEVHDMYGFQKHVQRRLGRVHEARLPLPHPQDAGRHQAGGRRPGRAARLRHPRRGARRDPARRHRGHGRRRHPRPR